MDYETPEEIRNNTQRDPILIVAGFIWSVYNVARYIVCYGPRLVSWLLLLYYRAVEKHGPNWWEFYGMPPLFGAA